MAKLLIERLSQKKYHDCDVDRYIPTLCVTVRLMSGVEGNT